MDSFVPLLLFLGFLFGSILLMLILSCRGLADRFDESEPTASGVPEGTQRFLAKVERRVEAPAPPASLTMSWASVEAHLRHEHKMASAFVAAPSLQMLFAHSITDPTPYLRQLEEHVQREYRRVTDMVQRLPAESLYPHARRLTFVPTHDTAISTGLSADLRRGLPVDDRAGGEER